MVTKRKLTKSFLEKAYVKDGLSTWAIEKKYGFSRSTVYTALKKFNIPTRNIAGSHIKYSRKDFSGCPKEKAYMLGFVIGDMRVRNHNKEKSETISIASGSTKPAQIELIENLFKPYGRVWVGKPNTRGVVNAEAFVNKSFSFLLPKIRDYYWCSKQKSSFFSFLAGFTDAEGSFFVSRGKVFVSWGNYDMELLRFIRENLVRFEIQVPKMYSDKLKGHKGTHGYARNANYHHISICKMTEVKKVLKELKPYLRHGDKLKKLAEVEKNLKLRMNK